MGSEYCTEVAMERYMSSEVSTEVVKERSPRSIPPVYAPSFVISHGGLFQNQTFCIPSDGTYHVRSVPEMRVVRCVWSCYGWLMLQSGYEDEENKCHLFNPATLTKIELPTLPDNSFGFTDSSFDIGVLSCPPTDPNCVVMFFHFNDEENQEKKNPCNFCRIGDKTWIEQEVSDEILEHPRVVSSNGKIYLFSYKRMFVIDVQDNVACIEPYDIEIDLQFFSGLFRGGYTYLLESCGDIFRVDAVRLGCSRIVQNFLVFKFDFSKMAWIDVESLGNRIFLLGENSGSLSVAPSEFGAKGNCIYFFARQKLELYCFDMEVGTIKVTQLCPTKFRRSAEPYWVVPNCKVQVKKQVADATKEIQVTCSNLPPELLPMIFQSLCSGDHICFRLACKAYISMTSPIRSFPLQILPDSQQLPWLISLPHTKNKNVCHLHHPIYSDAYTMSLPQLAGAIVRHAKFGWLLMSSGRTSLFFFNPITLESIQLPSLPSHRKGFVCISFSAPPTSSDFFVFGHFAAPFRNSVEMWIYRKTRNRWFRHFLPDLSYTFVAAHCNPVFHNAAVYCLSKDGKLGVFNLKKVANGEDRWIVYTDLSVPDVKLTPQSDDYCYPSNLIFNSTRSFIVEYNGIIFSVFVGFTGNPVHVYKLDKSKTKMKWVKVGNLGDRVMFLSHTTSLLTSADLKGTENRIYFPRFRENGSIFYSLKSGNYHCFGEQDSRREWVETWEHCHCTWFQTSIGTVPVS